MCKIDNNFKKYFNENESKEAITVYEGILESYLLLHTSKSILVFRHKNKNDDVLVWNIRKPFDSGHSHFKSLEVAKLISNLIGENKKPKQSTCIRNLKSYLRIADEQYIYNDWVSQLIDTKIDKAVKNKHYININKGI